ncbi:hypothetical protein P3T36_007751 [Kitasatospora sp. MAP12-15]|nr:hypothetical protein [Kitasatospora sp. MAP12-44]MDH6115533.1 hypothetical protein [Kitasatospora sp. MAP12-44]
MRRRPVGEILADLEQLDTEILVHHLGLPAGHGGDPTTTLD